MIRNVVVGRLKDGVTPEEIEPALQALRDLKVEGVEIHLVGGVDRGLREGNASYALTCDLVDDEAYRIYDADPEHNRIRREMFAPLSVLVERVQFQLPYEPRTRSLGGAGTRPACRGGRACAVARRRRSGPRRW